jgi:hypothetical protein
MGASGSGATYWVRAHCVRAVVSLNQNHAVYYSTAACLSAGPLQRSTDDQVLGCCGQGMKCTDQLTLNVMYNLHKRLPSTSVCVKPTGGGFACNQVCLCTSLQLSFGC